MLTPFSIIFQLYHGIENTRLIDNCLMSSQQYSSYIQDENKFNNILKLNRGTLQTRYPLLSKVRFSV